MDKYLAVRQINAAAEWRMRHELRYSEYMQDELGMYLEYQFIDEKLARYELVELDNGFYLGNIVNGKKNGFGAYLWYNDGEPNDLYLGYWRENLMDGDGFYCMSGGSCYCGSFANGEFQGSSGHLTSCDGSVDFQAEFYNGDIVKVYNCKGPFSFKGKSYGHCSSGSSSGGTSSASSSDSGSTCLGYIVIIAIIWGCFKYCGSCSCSSDNHNRTEISEATTTYVCTARKSLKVRTLPSMSAPQKGSIMSGEEVEVYNISDGFAKIRFNGDIGYASTKYLRRK